MLYRRFCQFCQQQGLLSPGDNVVLGISGGPDSIVLGHLVKRWQAECGGSFSVGHLNHGLRAAAQEEAVYTAHFSAAWGWPCRVETVDIAALVDQSGESLQAVAREERLKFFQRLLSEFGATKLALGHQADDQAETVLFWFLRGCGLKGLGGIRPLVNMEWGQIIHPLLIFSRQEILAYLKQHDLTYFIDESNNQPKYLRNRLRLELLPKLRREYNPRLTEHLVALAEQLATAEEYLEDVAAVIYQKLPIKKTPAGLSLAVNELIQQPAVFQPRLFAKLIQAAGGDLARIQGEHYLFLRNLLGANKSGAVVTLPGGLTARREFDELLLGHQRSNIDWPACQLNLSEVVEWGNYRFTLNSVKRLVEPPPENSCFMAGDNLEFPLTIRSFLPGDQLDGKKLKRFFNKIRLPLSLRQTQPLIATGKDIVCLPGLKIAVQYQVNQETMATYQLSWDKISHPKL